MRLVMWLLWKLFQGTYMSQVKLKQVLRCLSLPNTVVLFIMARPKHREFGALGMIAGTKDREGIVAITVLSIPLFIF